MLTFATLTLLNSLFFEHQNSFLFCQNDFLQKKDEERDFNLLIGRCLMSMCMPILMERHINLPKCLSIFSILICHLHFYIFPIIDSHYIFFGSNTASHKSLAEIQMNRKFQSYVLITQHESRIYFIRKLKTCKGHAELNHGTLDLQSNVLPLSYIPKYYDEHRTAIKSFL